MSVPILDPEVRRLRDRLDDAEKEIRRLRGDGGVVTYLADVDMRGRRIRHLGKQLRTRDATFESGGGAPAPGTAAPVDAQYVTLATNSTLSAERVLTAGSGVTITSAAGTVTIAASGKLDQWVWDDFGAATGTTHTLSQTPTNGTYIDVFLTGYRLKWVAAAPVAGEFSVSGTTLTLGLAKTATDSPVVTYPYSVATFQAFQYDDLTGAASDTFTLSQTPNDPDEIDLFLTGMRLHRKIGAPGPTEFSITGTAGTLGLTRAATDPLIARYVVAP